MRNGNYSGNAAYLTTLPAFIHKTAPLAILLNVDLGWPESYAAAPVNRREEVTVG